MNNMDNPNSNKTYIFNDYVYDLLGNIYRGFLEYLKVKVYTKFKSSTIDTYYKAVETWSNEPKTSLPPRPSILVDPLNPISIADAGLQLWRLPIGGGFQSYIFDPLFKSNTFKITPFFVRYRNTINISIWFQSIYEALEMQVRLLQYFNGMNRFCKPYGIYYYSPLPTVVLEQGEVIDWSQVATPMIYSVTGKSVYAYPIYICPMMQLTSLNDETTKQDLSIPDYKLGASFDIQMEIPVAFNIESLKNITNVYFNLDFAPNGVGIGPIYTDTIMASNSTTNPYYNNTGSNTITNNSSSNMSISIQNIDIPNNKTTTLIDPVILWNKTTINPNNTWIAFQITQNFNQNETFSFQIPKYDNNLDYVLMSNETENIFNWFINNGILYIYGPILANESFVLYGYTPNKGVYNSTSPYDILV